MEENTVVTNMQTVVMQSIAMWLRQRLEVSKLAKDFDLDELCVEFGDQIYLKFSRRSPEAKNGYKDASCDLLINYVSAGEMVEHTDGSWWRNYKIGAYASWPSYSTSTGLLSFFRAELISDVALIAFEVEQMFADTYPQMIYSAAQAAAIRARQVHQENTTKARKAIETLTERMRVNGSPRTRANNEGIAPGEYTIEHNPSGKTYNVVVNSETITVFRSK